jgi:hypothetical protein
MPTAREVAEGKKPKGTAPGGVGIRKPKKKKGILSKIGEAIGDLPYVKKVEKGLKDRTGEKSMREKRYPKRKKK